MNAKENRVILLRTEVQTLEQRNQVFQTRLEGIISSHKVTFADDRLCHTSPEEQTQGCSI